MSLLPPSWGMFSRTKKWLPLASGLPDFRWEIHQHSSYFPLQVIYHPPDTTRQGNLSRPSASVRQGGERGAGMEHQFPRRPCWTQRRVGGSCPLGVWLEEGGRCQNSFLLLDDPCPVLWPGEYTALEVFFVCVCCQFWDEAHEGPQGLPVSLPQVLSPLSSPPPSFHLSVFLDLIIVCAQGSLVEREGTWEKRGYSIWVQQEVSTPQSLKATL